MEIQNTPVRRNRIGLIIFLTVVALFLGLNIALVLPFLLAVLMGSMLTVLTRPAYAYLVRHGWGPKTSAAFLVIGVLVLVIGPLVTFATVAVNQGMSFGKWLAENNAFSMEVMVKEARKLGPIVNWFGGTQPLESQIRTGIQSSGKLLTGAVLSVLSKFPNLILQVFLALITCFFLLLDGNKFLKWISGKVPLDHDVKSTLSTSLKDTSVSVVWSTLAAGTTQALLMFLAFMALGVPRSFLAAGATFVFAWIPLLGSTPVWIGGAIYLFIQGETAKLVLMLVAGAITGVADNFVRAWVLKGRSHMHPLVSIIAIFGGIELFGIFGVFLGPILVGALTVLLQIWPVVGRRFGVLPATSDLASKTAA